MSIVLGYDPMAGLDGAILHKSYRLPHNPSQSVAWSIVVVGPVEDRLRFRQSIIDKLNPHMTRDVDFSCEDASAVKKELEEVYNLEGVHPIVLSMHDFPMGSGPNEEYAMLMVKRGPMFGVTTIAEFDTSLSSHAHQASQRADVVVALGANRDDTWRLANGFDPPHDLHDAHVYRSGAHGGWLPILLDLPLTHSTAERMVE